MAEQLQPSDIACTLSDKAFQERRTAIRQALLPHLLTSERTGTSLRLTFAGTAGLRSRVAGFVDLERQCCGFLTFTLAPPDDDLVLTIEGPPDAQATLDLFAEAVLGQ
jgi:hypothetical protein